MAAEQGFFALGVCNSPCHGHFVLPWGGRKARLATNPMSFAVPCGSGHPIVADFSTAEATEGKIRLHRNLGEPLPGDWIVDAEGNPSRDPADFYGPPMGAILPFGGDKGYRGFALSLLVEILGGLFGGSRTTADQPGNGLDSSGLSQPFSHRRLCRSSSELRLHRSPPQSGGSVLPENWISKPEKRLREGIPVDETTWEQINTAAHSVGVHWS
jgi:uncharacterized oxidoreductase